MANTPSEEEMLARQASFIFKGTVQKLKASNVAQVEAGDKERTIIVHVDEIMKAPEGLTDFAGQDVTVKLRGGSRLKVGDQVVFYTNGWIRAENLAVEEVGHRSIEDERAGGASDAAVNSAARELQKRLASADLIITGRVVNVRFKEDTAQGLVGSANLEKPARFLPASEPESRWREAVVHVTEVLKGAHASKEIVVRFPVEHEAGAAKFQTGAEGLFILHKTRKAGDATEETTATATAYTALHTADVQPLARLEQIRKLIKESTGNNQD